MWHWNGHASWPSKCLQKEPWNRTPFCGANRTPQCRRHSSRHRFIRSSKLRSSNISNRKPSSSPFKEWRCRTSQRGTLHCVCTIGRNAMFDMAFTQTTNLVKNRLDSYTPEATGMWNNFKKYFQVSNQFVVGKLRCLLFPFGSRSWKRVCQVNDDGTETFFPPRQDLNAPDLYIPLMAIFTYIVTVGFMAGTKGHFSPKVISSALSACSVAVLLELMVLKLVLYIISCPVPIFDLLALISYKFVG